MAPIRVLLVDDHDIFRTGLRRLLDDATDVQVVGEARHGDDIAARVGAEHPDVALVDIRPGVDALARLAAAAPGVPLVVLTADDREASVLAAIRMGARGYVLKDAAPEEIAAAVRAAADGGTPVSAAVAGALTTAVRRAAPPGGRHAVAPALTARERAVLALLADGDGNADIAAALHLSPSTVKSHVAAILEKLGAENRVQAAVAAVREGLLDA